MSERDAFWAMLDEVNRLLEDNRYAEAQKVLGALADEYPDSPEISLKAALLEWARDELDEARTLARRAVEEHPDDAGTKFRAASLLYALGDVKTSATYAHELSQDLPENFPFQTDLVHLLGCVAWRLGKLEHAEEGLKHAFEVEPAMPGHGYELARFYYEHGRVEESLDVIQRTREVLPDTDRLLKLLRQVRHRLDDPAARRKVRYERWSDSN